MEQAFPEQESKVKFRQSKHEEPHTVNKNNFDGTRIVLALIVVFAHIAALTQDPGLQHLEIFFDSNFAVKGFFSISGFLVTRSYLNSQNIIEYAEKRFRRIYPAYATAVMLCLCIGLLTTTISVSDFLKSAHTLKYIIANLSFLNFLQPTLPAVFETNPIQAMNGSLWTIKIEVMLYVCVPMLSYCFRKYGTKTITIATLALSIAWVYFFTYQYGGGKAEEIARQFPGQLSYFVLGAFFATNEKALAHIRPIAFMGLAILFMTNNPLAKLIIDPVAYSSIVIYFSTSAFRNIPLGRYGDISYGIYLYHFPIIQLLIFMGVFEIGIWAGMLSTLAVTLITALASWHLIEKRLLKRTSHYVTATKNRPRAVF